MTVGHQNGILDVPIGFADVFASLHDDLADQLRFIDAVLDLPRDLARRIRPEFEIVGFAGRDMQ